MMIDMWQGARDPGGERGNDTTVCWDGATVQFYREETQRQGTYSVMLHQNH